MYKQKYDDSEFSREDIAWIESLPEKEDLFIKTMKSVYLSLLNKSLEMCELSEEEQSRNVRSAIMAMAYYFEEDGKKMFGDAIIEATKEIEKDYEILINAKTL